MLVLLRVHDDLGTLFFSEEKIGILELSFELFPYLVQVAVNRYGDGCLLIGSDILDGNVFHNLVFHEEVLNSMGI